MTAPRGLLFDVGGTLLREERFDLYAGTERILAASRNPRGVSIDEVNDAARVLDYALRGAREASMIEFPAQGFQRLLYERFGIETPDPLATEQLFWEGCVTLVREPFVVEALEAAARRGLPLAVLSNNVFSAPVLQGELERHGLLAPFAFVASSADYGFRKPHPALFQTMAGKLGLPAGDVWYLGNDPVYDVGGAREAGMVAVFYNRDGRPAPEPPPHFELADWSRLEPLLAEVLG